MLRLAFQDILTGKSKDIRINHYCEIMMIICQFLLQQTKGALKGSFCML